MSVPSSGYQRLSDPSAAPPSEEVAIKINETNTTNPVSASPPPSSITLIFRTLTGQQMRLSLTTLSSLSILDLKRRLEEVHNIPVNFQRLIFAGRELVDTQQCIEYGLENECVIHLLLRQNVVNSPAPPVQMPVAQNYNPNNLPPSFGLPIPVDQYGNPVQIAPSALGDLTRHSLIFRLSRVIRMFTLLDLIFLVIWSLQWNFLILAFPLALAGYYGTSNFKPRYIACYLLYIGLAVGLRIWFITESESYFVTVLLVLGILIELYIGTLVWKFLQLLRLLPEEERIELVSRNQLLQRSMFN
jgi:large subunit ribosomal protein L40e